MLLPGRYKVHESILQYDENVTLLSGRIFSCSWTSFILDVHAEHYGALAILRRLNPVCVSWIHKILSCNSFKHNLVNNPCCIFCLDILFPPKESLYEKLSPNTLVITISWKRKVIGWLICTLQLGAKAFCPLIGCVIDLHTDRSDQLSFSYPRASCLSNANSLRNRCFIRS